MGAVTRAADTVAEADIEPVAGSMAAVVDSTEAAEAASAVVGVGMVAEADTANRRLEPPSSDEKIRLAANVASRSFCFREHFGFHSNLSNPRIRHGLHSQPEGRSNNLVLCPAFLARMCGRADCCGSKIVV
jgi:hypothetical protein